MTDDSALKKELLAHPTFQGLSPEEQGAVTRWIDNAPLVPPGNFWMDGRIEGLRRILGIDGEPPPTTKPGPQRVYGPVWEDIEPDLWQFFTDCMAYLKSTDHFPAASDSILDELPQLWARQFRGLQRSSEGWRDLYNSYLESEEWQSKRRLVMAHDQFQCRGCGRGRATQVHHLSYEHVGDEFLWELVAVCDHCHSRIHDEEG